MVKKYKPFIIVFYLLAIASLITASFVDLNLDKILNNPSDPFSIWFYNTGEMPSRIVLPLAGTIIFYLGSTKFKKLIGLVLWFAGSVWMGIHISDYFFVDENASIFGAVYGIGLGLISIIIGKYIRIPDDKKEIVYRLAVLAVLVLFAQILITEGSKFIWGRFRFRAMLEEGCFDKFTPWYHINGLVSTSNEYKSFPSGHTAGAAISYLMMYLPLVNDKYKNKQLICFGVPLVYSSIVAYTRMVMGAHFLSDVTAGAIISFTAVLVSMIIYDKKNKTKN